MASAEITKMRNNPEYKNSYAVRDAFNCLCEGLRPFAEREMKQLHSSLISKTSGAVCNCPSHTYVKTSCIWAKELGKLHYKKKKSRIPWHQSDSSKWHDPAVGYWEIAKIFMSDLGNDRSNVKDPSSTDSTGLLNLLCFCKHFKVQQTLVKSVREWRNKLAHSPSQLLTDVEKNSAIDAILKLVDDPELLSCNEVQNHRQTIDGMRSLDFSILPENELKIWEEVNKCKLTIEGKREQKKMKKAAQRIESDQRRESDQRKESDQNQRKESKNKNKAKVGKSFYRFALFCMSILIGLLYNSLRNISKYFCCFLLMSYFLKVGDKDAMLHSDNGCPRATVKSPISHLGFQEFNFSSKLSYKRNNFYGRKWLFQELESIYLNGSGPLGVLITGAPGSGKSAIMSQLICSPHSSLLIHNNIIGYHMCDYSEKGKRDGARFVRNLVDQIASSIPEYSDFVTNNEQVRKVLEKRCESDQVGCFADTIVGPLRELKNQPDSLKYIFIDALDECLEKDRKSSTILEILKNKLSLFPNWLKIILSSRNWTTVIEKLPQSVKRMVLDPVDKRNLEDIHFYITHFLFQNSFFMDRLLEAMGLTSTEEGINELINEMSRNGEGNFLFVKTTLEYLNASELGRINLQSFPTSLYDTYDIYFERQFDKDEFSNYKLLFEVLLAARSPLKLTEIASILKHPTSLLSELLQQVSSFLRFEQDGTVSIYHQSFAEWLENKTDSTGLLSINKSRGHQNIADNFFDTIEKRNTTPHLQEVAELAVHVLLGGMAEKQLIRMKRINISNIRDPCHFTCILHDLAVRNKTAPILNVFIKMFVSADVPDCRGMTPAFHAASEGNVENMKVFIKNGIDLDYRIYYAPHPTEGPVETIIQKMLGLNGYRIVHIAAQYGKLKIVRLLIKNGAYFEKPSAAGLTPLHVAAQNGHLAVVEQLYRYGAKADIIALHHAAARNHTKIVEFLLKDVGLKDKCLPCKPGNISDFGVNTTIQDIHSAFCETALHAAVSRGHLDIVKLLISFGKAALECKHYSGKTVLMDAVERNDTEMVDLLLREGADVDTECGSDKSEIMKHICPAVSSLVKEKFLYILYCETANYCTCGTQAIHVCGNYGLWKMAVKLIYKWHAKMLAKNCKKWITPHFAVINDHADFVKNFNRTLFKLTRHILLNKAFINLAVLCGSNRTLILFSDNAITDVIREIDENGRTLLHYAAGWSPYSNLAFLDKRCIHVIMNDSSEFFAKTLRYESKKRLITIKILTESYRNMTWFINLQDKDGRSALHYAALGGFASVVKYFVRHGGDWRIKDQEGNTPLLLALAAAPKHPNIIYRYRMESETVKSWNTTTYDETAAYLISRAKSSIKKCDMESFKIFSTLVQKKMPLSLYKLLKIAGVDVNCTIRPFGRPFLRHLQVGDKQVSEIFKIFKISVNVECNISFSQSELHLMSFFGTSDNVGNFFKSSFNGQSLLLERLPFKNPGFFKNFDQCCDASGYLAVHRAAKGGNLDAIDWFIRGGVDLSKKTRSGLTALDISIFVLETAPYQPLLLLPIDESSVSPKGITFNVRVNVRVNVVSDRRRQRTFKTLLLESWKRSKNKGYSSWCDSKLERLSPLHFAGAKGVAIFEFVYKKAVKIIPGLPRKCTNKHNVVPGYLSHVYKPDPSCNILERQGMQIDDKNLEASLLGYPDQEAEYHIIYNKYYESPEVDINFRSNIRDAVNCSGFYDLLPKRDVLDEKMKRCYSGCYVLTSYVYNYSMNLLPLKVVEDCQNFDVNDEWSRKIVLMSKLQYFTEKYNFPFSFMREIQNALTCSRECRCMDIKRVLQREFTSRFRENAVLLNKFTAKRMGWKDASLDGDVRDRWPFNFFVKKALNEYNSYQYLKTLNSDFQIGVSSLEYYFSQKTYRDLDSDDNGTGDNDDSEEEDDDRHDNN